MGRIDKGRIWYLDRSLVRIANQNFRLLIAFNTLCDSFEM